MSSKNSLKKNTFLPNLIARHDLNIKDYYEANYGGYKMYYVKDVPTSKLYNAKSYLQFDRSFKFVINLVAELGIDFSKNLVKRMIEGAKLFHMGYDKPKYEEFVRHKELIHPQTLLYDWIKGYAYIKRYTQFLEGHRKYLHPLLFHDTDQNFPRLHPGTARIRCAQYLWVAENRDTLLDIVYYNKDPKKKVLFENKLGYKFLEVKDFNHYLRIYGYSSMEMYNRIPKAFKYDENHKVGWPEYLYFLKADQYIPYLTEAYYHIFGSKPE